MVALTIFVARTQLGKAMRSTSFDREAASMMGIDVDRVIAVTFFIGSALAGAAGVMFGLVFGQIYHYMGFIAGLKGFTAAVLGGIGSIPGAMVGGLIVGLAESYATGYLPQGSTFQNLYRLRAPDRGDPHSTERSVRHGRDPEGLMAAGGGERSADRPAGGRAGQPEDRRRRVGRERRGEARALQRSARQVDAGVGPPPATGAACWCLRHPGRHLPAGHDRGNLFRTDCSRSCTRCWHSASTSSSGSPVLLDLGYVAFFGCGAYLYAIVASTQFGYHWQAEAAIPVGRARYGDRRPARRAAVARVCSATTSRS